MHTSSSLEDDVLESGASFICPDFEHHVDAASNTDLRGIERPQHWYSM